jgi:hypothetical protein
MPYLEGRRIRFSVQIKTYPALVLVDPTNLTLTIKNKTTGTVVDFIYLTDAEVIRDSVGAYHCDWTPAVKGVYWYRFSCTGTVEDAAEATFSVTDSQVI